VVEVSAVALPRRGGAVRAAPSVVQSGPSSADLILPTRERVRSSPLALSEARRAWNRDRIGLVSGLRCECTKPSCRGRVPAVAESHRRGADQFVVAPAHFDDGVVVRAADRFFVVELRGRVIGCSPRKKR
jgi:hypothetical protein